MYYLLSKCYKNIKSLLEFIGKLSHCKYYLCTVKCEGSEVKNET